MIWIRADANSEIGSGHIMRCLSVASALKKMGHPVCFVLADDFAVPLLRDSDMEYKVLGSSYDKPMEELPLLCSFLEAEKPAVFLADSYFITPEYIAAVNGYVKTAYFDDCMEANYPVDMLINYNIYGDNLPYAENALREDTEFLLGPAYAPLREEFGGKQASFKECVRDVLVTTGGGDKYNLAGRLVEKALTKEATKALCYHIVSGAFNVHTQELKHLSAKHENVKIHQNVKDMASLMLSCDCALSAGGSTLYELCAVGVPMICFSFAENQKMQVETFGEKGLALYGGDYESQGDGLIDGCIEELEKLVKDPGLRESLCVKAMQCADGRGAERIARALCRFL